MLTLAIISTAILALYLVIYFIRYKVVPSSLSETFYIIDVPYQFTLTLFAMVFTIVMPLIEVTPDALRVLAFLVPVGIAFVGAAPCFKEEFEGKVHKTGALVAAVFALLWVILAVRLWWVILACFFVATILAVATGTLYRCYVFWLEMVAFGSVYTSLILSLV